MYGPKYSFPNLLEITLAMSMNTPALQKLTMTAIPYEQQFHILADAHNANGDPTVFVFDNYLRWKGVPRGGARPADEQVGLSPHFSVLSFPGGPGFQVYATMGASYTTIPDSIKSFDNDYGVRYEYLLHSEARYEDETADLLFKVAQFPFRAQVEVQPGYILPLGEPIIEASGIEFLYYSYPYLDDKRLNETQPWGQIERGKYLIHILWLLPIYRSEVSYIRRYGPEAFEEQMQARHQIRYDAFDFTRLPYVNVEC